MSERESEIPEDLVEAFAQEKETVEEITREEEGRLETPKGSIKVEKSVSIAVDEIAIKKDNEHLGTGERLSIQERKVSRAVEHLSVQENAAVIIEVPPEENAEKPRTSQSSRKSILKEEKEIGEQEENAKTAETSSVQDKTIDETTEELLKKDSLKTERPSIKEKTHFSVSAEATDDDLDSRRRSQPQEIRFSQSIDEPAVHVHGKKHSKISADEVQIRKHSESVSSESSKHDKRHSKVSNIEDDGSSVQEKRHSETGDEIKERSSKKYSKVWGKMLIEQIMQGKIAPHRGSRASEDLKGEKKKSVGTEQMLVDKMKYAEAVRRLSMRRRSSKASEHLSRKPKKSIQESIGPETRFSDFVEESTTTLEKKLKYLDGDDKRYSLAGQDSLEKKLRFGGEEMRKPSVKPTSKGMRFEYGECPKTCERFLPVENFSKIFVNRVTDDALWKGKDFRQQSAIRIIEGFEYTDSLESLSIASIGTYVCIFEWPTIEQFTVEIGTTKINEYLSYWKFEEDWKYCINFLEGVSDSACDFYQYEVRKSYKNHQVITRNDQFQAIFSIPCKQYPIPQATASVYFTFELSRVRPKHCLVDVYYYFEGQRLIHTPGKFTFQEERLFNIVDAKINFYKTLTF
ncbi:unnamed protein product [Tenebrio molitor]|nr:unnamed protein product [Tenebrio molitor]